MLKQLIQRLLDSRTTPAQAAHSALRNTSSSTSIFTGEPIYTAPEDGFITVEGKSEANGGSAIGISSNGENYFLRTFQSVKDWGQAMTAPVSKGETVRISLYNLTDIEVKFYKSFGGGYKALKDFILQGGVLCRLSRLYSSLRRSSCRVRRNGSEVKVFSQTQIPEQRSLLTTFRFRFIRLQATDGLHSAETGQRSTSALPESWGRVALTLKVISELQLRFGRGMPLVSIARQSISDRLRQNSFPAKGQRNTSLVGGASC